MNKNGGAMSVVIWIGSALVVILFLAGFLYFNHTMTNVMQNIHIDTEMVNFSYAVDSIIVPVDSAMNSLEWISFIIIVMLAFAILIENFYIREHPVLFFVHVVIVIIGIVAGIYVSNEYYNLMQSSVLGSTLSGFSASSYIMLYLPLWVAVIGIFGIILLIINVVRDPELKVRGGI